MNESTCRFSKDFGQNIRPKAKSYDKLKQLQLIMFQSKCGQSQIQLFEILSVSTFSTFIFFKWTWKSMNSNKIRNTILLSQIPKNKHLTVIKYLMLNYFTKKIKGK